MSQRCSGYLTALLLAGIQLAGPGCAPQPRPQVVDRPPRIDPDYAGVVVPPNLAPLNFTVQEQGTGYRVLLRSTKGDPLEVSSSKPAIAIPVPAWRELLQENRGGELALEVDVRGPDSQWRSFAPVTLRIAAEDIDPYLVYRRLGALYNKYVDIGIYQRDLESFAESPVLQNRHADRACLNCHTFLNRQPAPMLLHTRGRNGLTMLVARDGLVTRVDTRTAFNASPAAYSSWHPSGELVAFSVNKVSLFFHTGPSTETRDVFDAGSDLALYWVDTDTLTTSPLVSRPELAETWPEWSPDGRYLYFSRAPVLPIERYREVRYDLMRIEYDAGSRTWGRLDTVLTAAQTGLSITQPKVSPDGRFLVFCMAEYGSFPVFLASSDLYLMDLATGQYRRLEVDSDRTDSWHSWSSNSRWLVFSSKRRDGLFSRPYLSYVDGEGKVHKPILLPQEDPGFYDAFLDNFNVPVFIKGPVPYSPVALGRAVFAPQRAVAAILDPQVQGPATAAAKAAPEPYSPGARP